MIRLFLVDDHPILRAGLRALLLSEPELVVVGEAANGEALLAQLPTVATDVVLLDLHMPVLDGLATIQHLRQHYPALRILVLSMVTQLSRIGPLFEAGAHGYLLKTVSTRELVAAIYEVMANKQFLCSEVGLALLQQVLTAEPAKPAASTPELVLTARQQDVLRLLGLGLTTQQIADKLFTSPRTVETHRKCLLEKTGAKNTPALITYAMTHYLLRD